MPLMLFMVHASVLLLKRTGYLDLLIACPDHLQCEFIQDLIAFASEEVAFAKIK